MKKLPFALSLALLAVAGVPAAQASNGQNADRADFEILRCLKNPRLCSEENKPEQATDGAGKSQAGLQDLNPFACKPRYRCQEEKDQ